MLLSGHDGDEAVQELGPVLGLDLDDVGVPVIEEVPGARVDDRLLEGLPKEVLSILVIHRGHAHHHRQPGRHVQGRDQHQRQGRNLENIYEV